MNNEWDSDLNVANMTAEELRANQQRTWQEERRHMMAERELRRQARGYFVPPSLNEDEIRTLFPWHAERMDEEQREHDAQNNNNNREEFEYYRDNWSANRVIWICHDCGCFGYKQGDCSELFKCYCCHNRNITICRCGEVSRLIRNNPIGTNMLDVYSRRQERMRERRRNGRTSRS